MKRLAIGSEEEVRIEAVHDARERLAVAITRCRRSPAEVGTGPECFHAVAPAVLVPARLARPLADAVIEAALASCGGA